MMGITIDLNCDAKLKLECIHPVGVRGDCCSRDINYNSKAKR
jgi:hypothetical protein